MIIGELSSQLEKYSKQSDFEIRPDLELSQIVGQPFRGNLDLLPQGGFLAIQDLLISDSLDLIQSTLYKYLCQTCQSQRQEKRKKKSSAKPGIRSFPVCQKRRNSIHLEIVK